jgi:hypothetical protein
MSENIIFVLIYHRDKQAGYALWDPMNQHKPTGRLGMAVTVFSRAGEVLGSNFGRDTIHPDRVFAWFLSFTPSKCPDSTRDSQ